MPFTDEGRQREYQREWIRRKRAKEREATPIEKLEGMPTPEIKDEKDTLVKTPEQPIQVWLPQIPQPTQQPTPTPTPKRVQVSPDRINQLLAEIDRQNRETRESYAKLLISKLEAETKRQIDQARQIEQAQREKQAEPQNNQ